MLQRCFTHPHKNVSNVKEWNNKNQDEIMYAAFICLIAFYIQHNRWSKSGKILRVVILSLSFLYFPLCWRVLICYPYIWWYSQYIMRKDTFYCQENVIIHIFNVSPQNRKFFQKKFIWENFHQNILTRALLYASQMDMFFWGLL